MTTYETIDSSWGIRVNPSVKSLLSYLGQPKIAKMTPFATLLREWENGKGANLEEDDWCLSPKLAKADNVYVEILESSKLFIENESYVSVN